jgi:hypothetical protein
MKTVSERLALFFEALGEAAPANSADAALTLIGRVMDGVEDAHSGVPKQDNPPLAYQGRMYAPRPDYTFSRGDGGISAYSRGHCLELGPDGGIAIYKLCGGVATGLVFSKPGTNAQEAL